MGFSPQEIFNCKNITKNRKSNFSGLSWIIAKHLNPVTAFWVLGATQVWGLSLCLCCDNRAPCKAMGPTWHTRHRLYPCLGDGSFSLEETQITQHLSGAALFISLCCWSCSAVNAKPLLRTPYTFHCCSGGTRVTLLGTKPWWLQNKSNLYC